MERYGEKIETWHAIVALAVSIRSCSIKMYSKTYDFFT